MPVGVRTVDIKLLLSNPGFPFLSKSRSATRIIRNPLKNCLFFFALLHLTKQIHYKLFLILLLNFPLTKVLIISLKFQKWQKNLLHRNLISKSPSCKGKSDLITIVFFSTRSWFNLHQRRLKQSQN